MGGVISSFYNTKKGLAQYGQTFQITKSTQLCVNLKNI